jgi:hypothetical protein
MATPNLQTYVVSQRLKSICAAFMIVGLIAFIACLATDKARAWNAYLIGLFYFSSIALGGLFFTAIQHVTKAGWSVNIRRLTEAFTAFLPYGFVFALIFLVGAPNIYKWLDPKLVASDTLIAHKSHYLNMTFFAVRVVLFFGLWILFRKILVGLSVAQDTSKDENLTHKSLKYSIMFIPVFALSYSLFAVDTLMSLDPHWFSTIFGVYAFAGLFQSSLAMLALFMIYGMKKGLLKGWVDENHLHDVGKFVFAFTVFWAYIAFSQYMLIWYANLPEETIFYIPRSQGSWAYVSIGLLVFKFIVPFICLLPQGSKRKPELLAPICVLILIMQFVDLYWLVYPNFNEEHVVFSFWEIFIFLGFAGAFFFATSKFLSQNKIVAIGDPRIHESMHHHVVY